MARFRRTRRGIEVKFDSVQAALLDSLLVAYVRLVTDGLGSPAPAGSPVESLEQLVGLPESGPPAPDDPVLARLFPDAYRDDAAAAAEFRRFTAAELRDGKLAAAELVRGELHRAGTRRLLLDEPAAEQWLVALNDLRLVLGTRLDVTEDLELDRRRWPAGDPHRAQLHVYEWLGVVLESLVHALAAG